MAQQSWTEQAIEEFFAACKAPTRSQCDQLALRTVGTSAARPVDVPGSLSYTVICTRDRTPGLQLKEDIVVSFRRVESGLDERLVELARSIHGNLVPQMEYHGTMDGSDPPLGIYTMPLLPGLACLEALSYQAGMDPDEEAKHVNFVTHLARYFARCRSAPQSVEPQARADLQAGISRRLSVLIASQAAAAVPTSTLHKMEVILPSLFTVEYPQVLTHGDLTKTNILVDPDTFGVMGIVDWSLAGTGPFGLELDCLWLMTGCMDLNGWHDYLCRPRLLDAFWTEFWTAAGIEEDAARRDEIRKQAEAAAGIGAVLRYAFGREADGRPSETPSTSESIWTMLKAWLGGEQSDA